MSEYIELITSEHLSQPNFIASVEASIAPLVKIQAVLRKMPADFDIDTAIGVQLDTLGAWIGRARRLGVPLSGVYFEWDTGATVGWDAGVWKGFYDPDSGLVDLPDDAYRLLLKAKIAANSWDGTIPGAYAIWESIFLDSSILVQDNQNMAMIITVVGRSLSAIEKSLLITGIIPLKPAGVRVEYLSAIADIGKVFAFDVTPGARVDGWDVGVWAKQI